MNTSPAGALASKSGISPGHHAHIREIALDIDIAQLDHPLAALEMPDDLGQQKLRPLPDAGVVERPGNHDRQAIHPQPRHILHRQLAHRVIVGRAGDTDSSITSTAALP